MNEFNQRKYDFVSELSNSQLEIIMHEHGERYIMMVRRDMIDTVYSYDDLIIK